MLKSLNENIFLIVHKIGCKDNCFCLHSINNLLQFYLKFVTLVKLTIYCTLFL